MLRWRLLLGSLMVAGVVALAILDARTEPTGTWLLPLVLLLSLAASQEMITLFAARNLLPLPWTIYLGIVLLVSANWMNAWGVTRGPQGPLGWPMAALAAGVILVFLGELARYDKPGGVTERLAAANLVLAYVGLLGTFFCQLRHLGQTVGVVAVLSLLLVVKSGDIGAYTVGRLIGRHPLVPRLSPGKTWEGLWGGLAFACLGSWVAIEWLLPTLAGQSAPLGVGSWLPYGLLVGLSGAIGDLAESMLKRDLGKKDSSTWLPGFGGVLDILDSILLASPVAYLYWASGWIVPSV